MNILSYYILGAGCTAAAVCLTGYFAKKNSAKMPVFVLPVLCVLSVYLPVAQILKYQSLHFYTDFFHWLEILSNIVKSGIPHSQNQLFSVAGTHNYLSVHFVPLVFAAAIPFKIFPNPLTLIFFNYFVMISALIPVYKLAMLETSNKKSALLIAVLFLWYPTFQYIVLYEFEMLRFSIPVLLWMLYFREKDNLPLYYLFVLLGILVREEVGLVIMMYGVYRAAFRRDYVHGCATALLGFGAFLTILSLMSRLSGPGEFKHIAMPLFSGMGSSYPEVLVYIVQNPVSFLQRIFTIYKLANIFMLFLPLLFIPLLAPAVLLSLLPNMGIVLLSEGITHVSYMLYYVAPSVPFIFYAFIKAWPKVIRFFGTEILIVSLLAGCFFVNVFFGPSPVSLQFWFKHLRPAPFRTQNFHYSVYAVREHHRNVAAFVDLIPQGAIVSTQQFLQPQLFTKKGVMTYPMLESKDGRYAADFILLDATNNGLKRQSPAFIDAGHIQKIEDSGGWKRIKTDGAYFLFQKTGAA